MSVKPHSKELLLLLQRIMGIASDSSTYEKLACYVEKNYMSIIFMTAGELAAEAGVSQGSVSRFCSTLGYRGYNEFLRVLQKFVSEEITAPQRLQYISKNGSNSKVRSILDMEHKNIDELEGIINQPSYHELVEKLVSAETIVLLSARMSATLLPYTAYVLNKIRGGVVQLTPHDPGWDTLNLEQTNKTLIFTFVFPRYPNTLITKLQELKAQGFTIAAITDSMISPVAQLAQSLIYVPITISSIFDIYSTPLMFINLLLRDVAKRMPGLNERLQALEKIDAAHNIYYQKFEG